MVPVYFAIPFAGRRDEQSWRVSCSFLAQTLRSILAQTDPDFSVIVAGHERPAIAELSDNRVTFLAAPFEKPEGPEFYMRDKGRKKRHAEREIVKRGGGLMVLCDADDLVSSQLVAYVRRHEHPNGYLFTKGWMLDNGKIAPIPGARNNSFDQVCGSCAAFRVDKDQSANAWLKEFKNHKKFNEVAKALGRPLYEAELRGFIYRVNSGHSHRDALEGADELARKTSEGVAKNSVEITPEFAREFSLDAPVERKATRPTSSTPLLDAQAALMIAALSQDPNLEIKQRKAITGVLEREFLETVVRLAPPLVMEVGAHEGTFSRAVKRRLPSSRVLAIEANPEVFKNHRSSIELSGVELLNICASDKEGRVEFRVPTVEGRQRLTMGSALLDTNATAFNVHRVKAEPLDYLVPPQPCALWIDVEGFIGPVLSGASVLLRQCVALYVEVETRQRWKDQMTASDVIRRLAIFGLKPVLRDIARTWQYNLIFVR